MDAITECLIPVGCVAIGYVAYQMAMSSWQAAGAPLAISSAVVVLCAVGVFEWFTESF